MYGQETFHRGQEVGHTDRRLSAKSYNAMRLLLDYSDGECVFVPIRSMQYMAVIDAEEVIFVDSLRYRSIVEFSWQKFQPQKRSSLTDPVAYRFTYYSEKALES